MDESFAKNSEEGKRFLVNLSKILLFVQNLRSVLLKYSKIDLQIQHIQFFGRLKISRDKLHEHSFCLFLANVINFCGICHKTNNQFLYENNDNVEK